MKRISVKLVGSATPPFTLHVTPGMTAGEVLDRLNLANDVLAIPPAPNRYFAPDDAVYDELLEGDFLFAIAKRAPAIDPEKALEDLKLLLEMEEDKPAITIDINEARRELMQLLEIDAEEFMP